MPASGKGISEAVRQIMPQWLDNETIAGLSKKDSSITASRVKDFKSWVRVVRRKSDTGTGYIRLYKCNTVPDSTNLELEIRTSTKDSEIQYFAFKVNGKYVSGGDCRVHSVYSSAQAQNTARIEPAKTTETKGYKRFSQADLDKLNLQVTYNSFDSLFDSRD
jgi:hypothetical protein